MQPDENWLIEFQTVFRFLPKTFGISVQIYSIVFIVLCLLLEHFAVASFVVSVLLCSTTFLCLSRWNCKFSGVFRRLQLQRQKKVHLFKKTHNQCVTSNWTTRMDYQQYTGYQTMGYNSYHYQYATPNHLKVGNQLNLYIKLRSCCFTLFFCQKARLWKKKSWIF